MIDVNHLTRRYDTILAVDDIAFSIAEGEIVGFLGPNGAGKTTTLRMLVGYLQPTAGEISIGGKNINDDPLAIARLLGYLPEHNPLYDEMTVYDYLKFIGEIRHLSSSVFEERLDFVINKCGLREVIGQQIQTLSKGYRQRTGLAQAIIHDPDVLILDEPTSGLDPNQILDIRNLIRELGASKTVILSSHIMQEVQAVCDRVIIINKGRIVADEKKEDLSKFVASKTTLSVELEAEKPDFTDWLSSHPQVTLDDSNGREGKWKFTFSYPAEQDLQRDLSQYISSRQWLILSMYRQQHSLEEIFHVLTTEAENIVSESASDTALDSGDKENE